jgi:hypothetical protein
VRALEYEGIDTYGSERLGESCFCVNTMEKVFIAFKGSEAG